MGKKTIEKARARVELASDRGGASMKKDLSVLLDVSWKLHRLREAWHSKIGDYFLRGTYPDIRGGKQPDKNGFVLAVRALRQDMATYRESGLALVDHVEELLDILDGNNDDPMHDPGIRELEGSSDELLMEQWRRLDPKQRKAVQKILRGYLKAGKKADKAFGEFYRASLKVSKDASGFLLDSR